MFQEGAFEVKISARVQTLIGGIAFILIGGLTLAGNSSDHVGAQVSSYTQQRGIPDTATVSDSHNYGGRGSSPFTVATATLRVPVGGQSQSQVYSPAEVNFKAGQVISVLVDPADPGHSELPGKPFTTASDSKYLVPLALVSFALGGLLIFGAIRAMRNARRESS